MKCQNDKPCTSPSYGDSIKPDKQVYPAKKSSNNYDDLPQDVREAIETLTFWYDMQKLADDHQARVDRAIYYQNEIRAQEKTMTHKLNYLHENGDTEAIESLLVIENALYMFTPYNMYLFDEQTGLFDKKYQNEIQA